MDESKVCASSVIDLKSHRRRSVVRRLWESYAVDLITILQAANDGKCSHRDAQESMAELIPTMKMLRDGGQFETMLQKADLVILDKVFNDVTKTEPFDSAQGEENLHAQGEENLHAERRRGTSEDLEL